MSAELPSVFFLAESNWFGLILFILVIVAQVVWPLISRLLGLNKDEEAEESNQSGSDSVYEFEDDELSEALGQKPAKEQPAPVRPQIAPAQRSYGEPMPPPVPAASPPPPPPVVEPAQAMPPVRANFQTAPKETPRIPYTPPASNTVREEGMLPVLAQTKSKASLSQLEVLAMLRRPQSLRDAIVIREILNPPRALRPEL